MDHWQTKQHKRGSLLHQEFPNHFFDKFLDDKQIICYVSSQDNRETQWKTNLIKSTILPLLHWFHTILPYSDTPALNTCLYWFKIAIIIHNPHLHACIEQYPCCEYLWAKSFGPGHGLFSDRDVARCCWGEITVDLISPWLTLIQHGELNSLYLPILKNLVSG